MNTTSQETVGRAERGRVKWYSKSRGYGFITTEDGRDVFVHYSGIAYEGGNYRRALEAGEAVVFRLIETSRGPEARAVKRASND